MTPRGIRLWLPSALLLSQVPGCVPLHGPSTVTGTVGKTLSVSCQYEEKFKTNNKYWCRVSHNLLCKNIVKTRGSEEARNGRVSIRDHPDNLTFTVTLESLSEEDAGTYMCAVDIPFFDGFFEIDDSLGMDKNFKVELSIVPAPITGLSPGNGTDILDLPISSPVHTQSSVTTEDAIPAPSPQNRSLLSSLYFCVLVFLELPLFLIMLGAVLWVNRPQRCSGGSSAQRCYEKQ
ncbi:CMRF-35-like molecule 4 [Arvicanthis niloticus]|uniref:CMRF-35-like molecule 4 n=1 Tax=Arvicanthis niloticus TaxID=61156 RepID=UPI001486DB4D|nr:CMRF-35-like molecule 4 [Arvicanthis niloticus]